MIDVQKIYDLSESISDDLAQIQGLEDAAKAAICAADLPAQQQTMLHSVISSIGMFRNNAQTTAAQISLGMASDD